MIFTVSVTVLALLVGIDYVILLNRKYMNLDLSLLHVIFQVCLPKHL